MPVVCLLGMASLCHWMFWTEVFRGIEAPHASHLCLVSSHKNTLCLSSLLLLPATLWGNKKQASKQNLWYKFRRAGQKLIRAHLWNTLQKILAESKSKAIIQEQQWKNIPETPVTAITATVKEVWIGEYGALCLPPPSPYFYHKMLCHSARPYEQVVQGKKKKKKEPPASHTNKELVFLDGQFAHTGEITARNPTENQHSIAQTGT